MTGVIGGLTIKKKSGKFTNHFNKYKMHLDIVMLEIRQLDLK